MIYGTRASAVTQLRVDDTTCNHCNETTSQHVTVFGKYAHVMWIPFFPIGKIPVAECMNCKKTIPKEEFSNQLLTAYNLQKAEISSPKKHWIGAMLIGAIILFAQIGSKLSNQSSNSSYNGPLSQTALDSDYRAGYLETDMYSLTKTPLQASDSSAFLIKSFFDDFLTDEVDKQNIEYYTRAQGDKHITLLRIPEFERFQQDDQRGLLDMIQTLLDSQANIADKEKYIGIFNHVNFMGVKSPDRHMVSTLVPKSYIYKFYGEPKSTEEEK